MKYFYKTKFGTFFILPDINNGCSLWIKDNNADEYKLGWYPSAIMAADDVYMCATGFENWDDQLDVDDPIDLSEWTKTR